jgi:hypothetical protein
MPDLETKFETEAGKIGKDVGAAATTVFETAQTKKGRTGYIVIFILGLLVGGGLYHLFHKL